MYRLNGLEKTCVYLDAGSIPASSIGDIMKGNKHRTRHYRKMKRRRRHNHSVRMVKESPKSSWGAGCRLYSSTKRVFTANEEVEYALRREAEK